MGETRLIRDENGDDLCEDHSPRCGGEDSWEECEHRDPALRRGHQMQAYSNELPLKEGGGHARLPVCDQHLLQQSSQE